MSSVPERPARNAREALDRWFQANTRSYIPTPEIRRLWAELEEEDPGATERLGRAMGRVLFAAARGMALEQQAERLAAAGERDGQSSDAAPSPQPKPKRTRRPKPSKLAAFEAQWQAEHAADESTS